jgi:drug/metabolite transporter (DMT)-like permease
MPALLVTSLLWAFSFGLIKHYLAHVDPRFVAFCRLALAAILFVPWLRPRQTSLRQMAESSALGAVQFGSMYLLYLLAFPSLFAYQVALLTIVTPIWVCVCQALLERRFSWRPIAAALLAILGTAVAMGLPGFGSASWRGIMLIQASNACFAIGQIWYRNLRTRQTELGETTTIAWAYVGAVVVTFPLSATNMSFAFRHLTRDEISVLLYLGLIASGLGFYLWNHGATRVSTGVLAVMNNVKTPLGMVVSLLWFGEPVQAGRLVMGSALVVGATLMAQQRSNGASNETGRLTS